MRKYSLPLLFILLAAPFGLAGDLVGPEIISQLYPCDGALRVYTWQTTRPIRIKRAHIFIGVDRGMIVDVVGAAYRQSDATKIVSLGWDHYAEPTGAVHQWSEDFGANYIELQPYDTIRLNAKCVPIVGSGATLIALTIWYPR